MKLFSEIYRARFNYLGFKLVSNLCCSCSKCLRRDLNFAPERKGAVGVEIYVMEGRHEVLLLRETEIRKFRLSGLIPARKLRF